MVAAPVVRLLEMEAPAGTALVHVAGGFLDHAEGEAGVDVRHQS